MADVVLASGSPRRLALLRRLGLEPTVRVPDVDEAPRPGESAPALVGRLASDKARFVEAADFELVIAADTVVVIDGEVLGKPADANEAAAMLGRLAGRTHAVMTGVAVRLGASVEREVVRTEVTFRSLSAAEVAWYVATGEPMDKAGAYGIQGAAAVFATSIHGSDTNVIGLPLAQTVDLARRVGVDLLA